MKKPIIESLKWWGKYIQRTFFFWLYEPKNQPINKDWVGIKISHSYIPEGFPENKEEVFKYLQTAWKDRPCIKRK